MHYSRGYYMPIFGRGIMVKNCAYCTGNFTVFLACITCAAYNDEEAKVFCCVCFQLIDSEEGSHLMNASGLSDTVLPSTPESPGEMFVSPLGSVGRSQRVAGKASPRLSGVSRLMKTPKQRKRQSADVSGLSFVRQLMRTSKVQKSLSLGGVKRLVTTPTDVASTPELDGIRNLVKTPKPAKSPELVGVKQLLKTPKAQKSPALDGVKKLVRTPKQTPKIKKSPQLAGLKSLMKTPKQQQSPVFVGVRQLMKTPQSGPKSPDFVGVSEMLASPQSSGSVFLESSSQKSVSKKRRVKEVSFDVSAVPSPKTPGTRGRKMPKKTTESLEVEAESLSVRRRGASRSKSADDDHMVVIKKVKSSKSITETELTEPYREVNVVISAPSPKASASRKGKSRGRSEDASSASRKAVAASEETDVTVSKDKVTKTSSTPVAKTRSKRQFVRDEVHMDEDSIHISQQVLTKRSRAGRKAGSFSSKSPARSSAKRSTRSKKTADASVLSTDMSVYQTSATRCKEVKSPEVVTVMKSERNQAAVNAGPSPRRLRAGVQTSKSVTVATELALAADGTAKSGGRKKTQQKEAAEDNVSVAQQVGSRNSRAARKRKDAVVMDPVESSENVEADVTGQSKGRGAKRIASPAISKNKATRSGGVQDVVVTESAALAENATVLQKSPAAVAIRGGRRGKRHEPQPVSESSIVVMSSGSRKRTQNTQKSAAGQRGKPVTSEPLQSTKSPVSTRTGKRQITVVDLFPAAENVKMQEKGQKYAEAAAVRSRRRGKHDESLEVVENSKAKTPSRSRKRALNDDPVEAPVSKSQRQKAQEPRVVEQPIKTATKTKRGKTSLSDPAEPVVQLDTVKTGVKKSGRKKMDSKVSVEVIENATSTSKKSDSKNAKKLKDADNVSNLKLKGSEKKKVDAEKKKAIVSPRATRSRQAKR